MKLPKLFNRGVRLQAAQLAETRALVDALSEYATFQMTRESLRHRLGELDPRLVNLLVDMSRYERLIGPNVMGGDSRMRTVETARYYEKWDIQVGNATKTWTDWGFGRQVSIKAVDPAADVVWQETWDSALNKPTFKEESLHEHSTRVLTDGEFFFVAYVSTADGSVTWRYFVTERITEIVHPPSDEAINLYYVVDMGDGKLRAFPDAFSFFSFADMFKDAKLPSGVVDVNQLDTTLEVQTIALVLPVQRNVDSDGRGWPQFHRAFAWSDVYSQMLREYSQVFSAIAMEVNKIKVTGGSRNITSLVNQIQSSLVNSGYRDTNPAGTAGGTRIENEAADLTRLPLGTAAGDAQAGTMIIAAQLATALSVKLSDVGRPDAFQNKAIADIAAESPQQGWQRYQTFWVSIWRQLVEITLRAKEEYTKASYTSYDAVVSMSLPIDVDTDDIKKAMDAVTGAAAGATLDYGIAVRANTALTRLMLLDLNVGDVDDVMSDAAESEETTPTQLGESHTAIAVLHTCPLCGAKEAYGFAGHGPLLVCQGCGKTYDPEVE